jgi:heterodisulfide reductase subunit A
MSDKTIQTDVVVVGAGVAGMEAALLLAAAGRRCYLVERTSATGGMVIKCEEVFANLECATCMIAPKQQEVLQNTLIELLTLSELIGIKGTPGDFTVRVRRKASYVDPDACIGCGACFEACPVALPNEFEENLAERKAISVPCAGALPNVPYIDTEHCVRFTTNDECTACQEACVFEAIDFSQETTERELHVGAVIVATGFSMPSGKSLQSYGCGKLPGVYTAYEFERLFASNGPTGGEIVLRDGTAPTSAAIVHCVGSDEKKRCAPVCSMYPLKFSHYFRKKLPDTQLFEFHDGLCMPGKAYQNFFNQTREHGVQFIRARELKTAPSNGKVSIQYVTENAAKETLEVDMLILGPVMEPSRGTVEVAKLLKLPQDEAGFLAAEDPVLAPVSSAREGVYVVGCARWPTDIQGAVAQAEAAVGRVLASQAEE